MIQIVWFAVCDEYFFHPSMMFTFLCSFVLFALLLRVLPYRSLVNLFFSTTCFRLMFFEVC